MSNVSLPELVEEDVELELGAEVAESAVAEGLERPVGDEGAQQVDVGHEGLQVGVLVRHRLTGLRARERRRAKLYRVIHANGKTSC